MLDEKDYGILLEKTNCSNYSPTSLLYYILDLTEEKKKIITLSSEYLRLSAFEVMPKRRYFDPYKRFPDNDYVYPSIEEWLSAFIMSDFIVTDSFHGTAFSIIFNKPFLVIGNEYRGLSRIYSLLEMFNLSDRLIIKGDSDSVINILQSPIDWDTVNQLRKNWKDISIDFIKKNLSS